jgi:hypothetical protein
MTTEQAARIKELEAELADERAGRAMLAKATDRINDLEACYQLAVKEAIDAAKHEQELRNEITELHKIMEVVWINERIKYPENNTLVEARIIDSNIVRVIYEDGWFYYPDESRISDWVEWRPLPLPPEGS